MINTCGLEISLTQLLPSAESITDGTQSEHSPDTEMLDFLQVWGGQDETRESIKGLTLNASEPVWPTPEAVQDIEGEYPAEPPTGTDESVPSDDVIAVRNWAVTDAVTSPAQEADLRQKVHAHHPQTSLTQESENPLQEPVISKTQREDIAWGHHKIDSITPKIDKISNFSQSTPNISGLSEVHLTDRVTRSSNAHLGDPSIKGRIQETLLIPTDHGLTTQRGAQAVDVPTVTEPNQSTYLGQSKPVITPMGLDRSPPTGSTLPPHPTGRGGVTALQNQTVDTPPPHHHKPQTAQSSSIVAAAPEKVTEHKAPQLTQPTGILQSTEAPLQSASVPFTAHPIDGHGPEMRSTRPAPPDQGAIIQPLRPITQPPAVPPLLGQSLALDSANDPFSSDPLIAPVQSQSGQPIQHGAPAILSASYAPKVAAQLASAAIQSSAGTTQILLNPEELGRVRMTLTTTDHGIAVSVMAERPETIELMRRHVDLLIKEFEDLDRGGVEFSFGENGANSGETESNPAQREPFTRLENATNPDIILTQTVVPTTGLDLKL